MAMQRFCFLFFLFLINVVACDDNYQSSIPEIRVDYSCSLLLYSNLQIPGQFMKVMKDNHSIPVGFAGIIVGNSVYPDNGYSAYDAACPVEAKSSVSVTVQKDGMGTAICPVCGTKYNLSNGGYPEANGTEYLKRYKVVVTGTTLRVSN